MLLNADLGEEVAGEDLIIPFLDLGSISCGAHAGNEHSIRKTIRRCVESRVRIGAHPSYEDRVNFGRMKTEMSTDAIQEMVMRQLLLFQQWALNEGAVVEFVKPHGALYNVSAEDQTVAQAIARAVHAVNPKWILMGLAGSVSITSAEALGLSVWSEYFADRRYLSDGTLCPRTDPRALLKDERELLSQIDLLHQEGGVVSVEGNKISVQADVLCIHGDGKQVLAFAKVIRSYLNQHRHE